MRVFTILFVASWFFRCGARSAVNGTRQTDFSFLKPVAVSVDAVPAGPQPPPVVRTASRNWLYSLTERARSPGSKILSLC